MTKKMKALLKVRGTDAYGPKKVNYYYEVTDKVGRVWSISRHKWCLPTTSWAWKAFVAGRADIKNLYEDTLDRLLEAIGFSLFELGLSDECDRCSGTGVVSLAAGTTMGGVAVGEHEELCSHCGGTGREEGL